MDLSHLSRPARERLAAMLAEQAKRLGQRKFESLFPDETYVNHEGATIYARHLYPRHLEFFAAGAHYPERCFMAANRVGKTVSGAYETTAHLTGLYPHWWEGKRFERPVRGWACGKTNETTRDIVQRELCGDVTGPKGDKSFAGTGMIPPACLGKITWKAGVTDLCDTLRVRHVSGGWSLLGFKSYQQGRGSFEGTAQHFVWDDEEPPMDVYGEQLIRITTTGGIVFNTFTPLEGVTETVMQFLPADQRPATADALEAEPEHYD